MIIIAKSDENRKCCECGLTVEQLSGLKGAVPQLYFLRVGDTSNYICFECVNYLAYLLKQRGVPND